MSSISSLAAGYINPQTLIGSYERNNKAFGPVTASVIGAADAMCSAASSTCSFSSEALGKLSAAASEGVDAVISKLGDAADAIEGVAQGAADAVSDAASSVGEVGGEVVDGIGDALNEVGSYVVLAGLAIGGVVDLSA